MIWLISYLVLGLLTPAVGIGYLFASELMDKDDFEPELIFVAILAAAVWPLVFVCLIGFGIAKLSEHLFKAIFFTDEEEETENDE